MVGTEEWRGGRSDGDRTGPDARLQTGRPITRRASLSPGVSVYIDLLRSCAALLVFIGHADGLFFGGRLPALLSHHAREAVAIFFVLSGFVISFASMAREGQWQAYVLARAARILPVVVLSLIVTLLCDVIGSRADPSFYDNLGFYRPETLGAALSYLTFTNQLWFNHVVFGTNEPFWSLGFEIWYYVLFGLVLFGPARLRLPFVLLWALLCGPTIVLYLPLWLMGVALYSWYARGHRIDWRLSAVLFPLSLIAYQWTKHHLGLNASNMFVVLGPWQSLANLGYFLLIGALTCLNIGAGGELMQRGLSGARGLTKAIRWVSGASFTLYLVHLPILVMLRSLIPRSADSRLAGVLTCALALALVLILAELGERRKKGFAEAFDWVMTRARALTA